MSISQSTSDEEGNVAPSCKLNKALYATLEQVIMRAHMGKRLFEHRRTHYQTSAVPNSAGVEGSLRSLRS